jgi:hypothetical protein
MRDLRKKRGSRKRGAIIRGLGLLKGRFWSLSQGNNLFYPQQQCRVAQSLALCPLPAGTVIPTGIQTPGLGRYRIKWDALLSTGLHP